MKPKNLIIYIFILGAAFIRPDKTGLLYSFQNNQIDTLNITPEIKEALSKLSDQKDTLTRANIDKKGIDSTVTYYAKDTVVFDVQKKKMRLRGNSKLEMKQQKLEAEVILLDFNESQLDASGIVDSVNKKMIGFPKFNDTGEEFAGQYIKYNFKSKKGTISLGETEMGEGFYFGSKIKRISDNELYVQNGYYTTCDAPHPHFFFGSTEMKVLVQDRIFLDPIIFYVEDMPIFAIPFGLFFPSKGGRQSGIIIPSFFFSQNRGVVLSDLGFYLALSDYYDTKFNMDYFSKGGFILKNYTQWNLLNSFNGSLRLEWGKTRLDPDDEFQNRYSIGLNHNQNLSPDTKIEARLDFRSEDYNRNTTFDITQTIQQNISSFASYSTRFDNGSSLSLSYQRDQNIITREYTESLPKLAFNLPNWNPLKSFVPQDSWLKDITVTYSGSARKDNDYKKVVKKIGESQYDTTYQSNYRALISHSPGISISPKFGYFTIQPSVSFSANNYFRRMHRTYNTQDSTTNDTYENGFFTEYRYSFGLSAQTILYGMIDDKRPFLFFLKPSMFGMKAIRHTWQPRIGFSYTPDQSDPSLGFYGTYFDPVQDRHVKYSLYEADGGGLASQFLSQSLNYSDMHRFEIKLPGKDTLPDKNLELLELRFNMSYNFAADSLKFSPLSLSFRSPALSFINFNGRANFTLYDEVPDYDKKTGQWTGNYRQIDRLLLSEGGFVRLSGFNIELSTDFSSGGVNFGSTGQTATTDSTSKDSVSLGERFMKRMQDNSDSFDIFGDHSPGYSPLNLPWSMNFGLSYDYNRPTVNQRSEQLNLRASMSFKLTPSWSFDANGQYDFISKELLAPSVSIRKDLHCWELSVTWYPTGYTRGFYLRFGAKAPQLKDLKIEKRNTAIYR